MREDGGYSYLAQNDFMPLGWSLQRLHATALENLQALEMPSLNVAKAPGGAEAFLSDDKDNFTAARILLPTVRETLAAELGAQYLLAIPCRDWFFCWASGQNDECQTKNRADARRIFREDDYNLTPDILIVTESGIRMYEKQDVDG